jgi:predicted ATP-dependent endonuclease of OLD family
MFITRILLHNYQQFDFLDLDLTYPEYHEKKGQPLEKVCFIGKNGTGKTTILNNVIRYFLVYTEKRQYTSPFTFPKLAIRLQIDKEIVYVVSALTPSGIRGAFNYYNTSIENEENWIDDFKNGKLNILSDYKKHLVEPKSFDEIFKDRKKNLLIYSPSEVLNNTLLGTSDLPTTTLNDALKLYKNFPYYHDISFGKVSAFWNLIIYQVKQRESDERDFLNLPENQNKTIAQLRKEFDEKNPFFLIKLSEIWNRILDKAGLYFDIEKVTIPMQLTENLQAYIKLKSTDKPIAYSRLSSGIRHYIFRLGYTASLFFNMKIKSAIILIDEPENSLFPDLLYDLIDQYSDVTQNSQFFYATHSPIIASQFDPSERIIFDFNDDNGKIVTRKGTAAIGDEPNDVLISDFGIQSLLGKEGIKKWERYIELKILIGQEDNESQKELLVDEFLKIGKAYNF